MNRNLTAFILVALAFAIALMNCGNRTKETKAVRPDVARVIDSSVLVALIREADTILIVMPSVGCPGCQKKVLDHISQDRPLSNTRLVITDIKNKKDLSLRLPKAMLNNNRISLDDAGSYDSIISEDREFPWVVFKKGSPKNSIKIKLTAENVEQVLKLMEHE